jgi:hypothetical protein
MTTVYILELCENKYYIAEFKNEIIENIETMIKKIVPNKDYDLMQSLLTQNLIHSLASIEWIKKYPFKFIVDKIHNTNIEFHTIRYMKKYGIENVRSDLHKDIELSESVLAYFQISLHDSNKSTSDRIALIDEQINKLKTIFNIITKNNTIIDLYKDYKLGYRAFNHGMCDKIHNKIQEMQKIQCIIFGPSIHNDKDNLITELHNLWADSINLLLPNFIDTFMKERYSNQVRKILEEHFSNHKIIDEISNALILEKKNENLISKYGTLPTINNKLTDLINKKIELIRMLDPSDIEVNETDTDFKSDEKKEECDKKKEDETYDDFID